MNPSNSKMYERLAYIYPYLMRTIHYDRWAEYIYRIAKSFVKRKDIVLELGAGTGKLAENLKIYYPRIIITDLSINMLNQDETSGISKVCCDMISTPFNTGFPLIYSAFDSVNYMTSRKKLFAFFKEINRILAKGGIFTFDVSLERNSLRHIKEPIRKGKYKGIDFIQKSWYSPKTRIHRNTFYLEIRDEKFCENHMQKIYPFEDYFSFIEKAGLYVAECFEAFTFKNGNAESERVQFVVRN